MPLSVLIDGIAYLREEAAAIGAELVGEVPNAEVWVRQQMKRPRAYSMVDADGHAIGIHPLVQTVERLQLDDSSAARCCRNVASGVA